MVKRQTSQTAAKTSKTTTTTVDRDLNTMANMVALHRGIDLRVYIDGILRPVIEKDFRQMGEEIAGK